MIKPSWAVNGVFALIALLLITVDVNQRHHSLQTTHSQTAPVAMIHRD